MSKTEMMHETPRVVVHMLDDQGCLTSSKVIEQDPMDVACDTLMDIEDVVSPRTPENIIVTSELSLDSGQDITDLDILRPDIAKDSTPAAKNDKPKEKKKRKREKNPDPPPETILPPCRICNEKSSGYHYGVNSCEACKGFFRRTLKKKEVKFKCKCSAEERNKWKEGPYKNGCAACRYERCLSLGMSKNAIKIGRYTINHKTHNITEAKEVQAKRRNTQGSIDDAPTPASTVSDADIEAAVSLMDDAFIQAIRDISPVSFSSSTGDNQDESSSSFSCCTPPATEDTCVSTTSPQASCSINRNRLNKTLPPCLKDGISLKEIDTMIKAVTEAHKSTLFMDDISAKVLEKQTEEFLEKYKLEKQLFGEMKALTEEEFMTFYESTGIDIDGRLEEIEKGLSFYEKKVSLIVGFGKALPGFKKLCLDDQASLIKASRLENILMSGYKQLCRNVDWEREVVTMPWGQQFHFDDQTRVISLEYFLQKTRFAEKVRTLDLSLQEEAIIRAVLVLSADRCELREPEKVVAIQEQLIQCLQYLLHVRHDGPGKMFYKIIALITDFRSLTEYEHTFVLKVMKQNLISKALKNYALIREFLT